MISRKIWDFDYHLFSRNWVYLESLGSHFDFAENLRFWFPRQITAFALIPNYFLVKSLGLLTYFQCTYFRSNTSRRGSDREPERPPRRANRRNPAASAKVRSPSPSVSSTSEATGSTAATAKSPNSLLSEEVLASLKGKTVQLKNAVMMLNEMFPPPRAPQYKVTSQVNAWT